jgi:AraC-like DNA-binding protein
MQRLIFSTDDVPEAERFSYWREAVMQGMCGVSGERNKDQETPFKARFVCSIGESLVHYHCSADGHPLFRRTRDIARRGDGTKIAIYRELGVVDWRVGGRREMVTRPGDLLVSEGTSPWASQARADFDSETWLLPRKLLDPHLPGTARNLSLVLTGRNGLAGIVKAYLDAFAAKIDTLDEREAGLVADNFCRLLAIACGAAAGEHQEAVRLARLEEAKRYIDQHLAEPKMTPEKAAAALKMSVRQLHLLFEPSGTSFAQYLLRRRLEECRAALLTPVGGRSVADIALGFGFNNLWTFNRNFRRAFGVTPSEARVRETEPGVSPMAAE